MATKTPIKVEKVMTTATTTDQNGQTQQVEEKEPRRLTGNPWMKPLNPSMRIEPHPVELPQGVSLMSDEFCHEKHVKTIIAPLRFESEAEFLTWAKASWKWHQQSELREKEAIARDLALTASKDPQVLAFLKQQLAIAA